MMPANNNGTGMNVGFPDVCLTPTPLGPVPIPYPNLASHCMAATFSPNIFVGYMPQLSMGTIVPLTNGDQAGVAHPLFMQAGGFTAGNPRVLINCLPAASLCTPTFGNLFNNPVGLSAVPSVTTTFYSDVACADAVRKSKIGERELSALRDAVAGDASAVEARALEGGLGYIRIHRMTRDVGTRFYNALRAVERAVGKAGSKRGLVIDLRGNPGGDLDAALDAARELVDGGAVLANIDTGEGPVEVRARGSASYRGAICVLVDSLTGSAAEAFAGALSKNGRAQLVGERTFGKACAQSPRPNADGDLVYTTVARVTLADGTSFDAGLEPDHWVESADALARATALLDPST
jgi:carboxyl-terminal processing protease